MQTVTPVSFASSVKLVWLMEHLDSRVYLLLPSSTQSLVKTASFFNGKRKGAIDLLSRFQANINQASGISGSAKTDIFREGFVYVGLIILFLPDPLTGHISGICPRAQQRPVSQQHCIFVYCPFSSAAQRPLASAEKQMPTRWSEREKRSKNRFKLSTRKSAQNSCRTKPSNLRPLHRLMQEPRHLLPKHNINRIKGSVLDYSVCVCGCCS